MTFCGLLWLLQVLVFLVFLRMNRPHFTLKNPVVVFVKESVHVRLIVGFYQFSESDSKVITYVSKILVKTFSPENSFMENQTVCYPNQACNNLKDKLFLASKMNQSSKHYIKHQTPQRTLPKMEEMVAIPEGVRLILMWELHTISTTPINISSLVEFYNYVI